MAMSAKLKQDLKNPWLRTILALVATAVSVNIAFVVYAMMVPPNLVVDDYYEKGKSHFHNERQREASVWRLQLLPPETPTVDTPQPYRLYVMDQSGQPVNRGQVTLFSFRPSDTAQDFTRVLNHTDTGTFVADITFPLPGTWDLIAQVETDGQSHDIAQRIVVQR